MLTIGLGAALIWAAFLFFSVRRFSNSADRELEDDLEFKMRAAPWSDRHVGSLLSRFPRSPTLLRQYVNIAAERKDWPEALRRADGFLAAAPRSPHAWLARIDALRRAGREEDATELLARAVRRLPRAPEILAAWASEAMRRKDWAEAARRYQRLRRRHPDRADVYEKAATALLADGRPDEAAALIAEGMHRTRHKELWEAFAQLAERAGDLEEAIRRWETMRAEHPAAPAGFVRGAEALARAGHAEAAAALIRQGRDIFPGRKDVAEAASRLAPAEATVPPPADAT